MTLLSSIVHLALLIALIHSQHAHTYIYINFMSLFLWETIGEALRLCIVMDMYHKMDFIIDKNDQLQRVCFKIESNVQNVYRRVIATNANSNEINLPKTHTNFKLTT